MNPDELRQQVAECRALAAMAKLGERPVYLQLAATWEMLARQVEAKANSLNGLAKAGMPTSIEAEA